MKTEEVRSRTQDATGVRDDLPTVVKKQKLGWYIHISRSPGMVKTFEGDSKRNKKERKTEEEIMDRNGPDGSERHRKVEKYF